jgi:membrane protease YdiL (CAAX protease family)
MANDEVPASDLPLVIRVPEPQRRPAPGLLEALMWSVVFLGMQLVGALLFASIVLGLTALQSPNPGQFLDEQLSGLGHSTGTNPQEAEQPRPPVPEPMGRALAYGMLGAQLLSLVAIVVVIPWRVGRDWRRELGFRRPAALHVLLMVLLVPGFLIVSGGIQELVAHLTGLKPPAALESLNGVFRMVPLLVSLLSVAVGPGFVEEVWCRGFLGRGLCARYGRAGGVLLTSVIFALMHLDPSQLIVITLMGAYLHFTYLVTRSIWVPIVLHMLNNGIAILVALTRGPQELGVEPQGVPVIVYLVGFSLVLFASIALWTSRPADSRQNPALGESNASGQSKRVSPVALFFTFISLGVLLVLIA